MSSALEFRLTHKVEDGRPVVMLTRTRFRADGAPVPKGFPTDFFSIPRWAQWLIFPPFAPGCEYAVDHDWDCNQDVPRPIRSKRLLKGLLATRHVPGWKAWVVYWAVLLDPGSEWDSSLINEFQGQD